MFADVNNALVAVAGGSGGSSFVRPICLVELRRQDYSGGAAGDVLDSYVALLEALSHWSRAANGGGAENAANTAYTGGQAGQIGSEAAGGSSSDETLGGGGGPGFADGPGGPGGAGSTPSGNTLYAGGGGGGGGSVRFPPCVAC